MSLQVRCARADDAERILRINFQCAPHVAKLDGQELRRLVGLASVAWVAESNLRVDGYLIGMLSSDDYDGEEFRYFLKIVDQPFIYVDQIAVDPRARRASVGSQLYKHLVEWSIKQNVYILCCEVNVRPVNPISMRFHEEFGFKRLAEIETTDRRRVAMLCNCIRRPHKAMESDA